MINPDITNFSSSSPHRLPTLSASEALQNLTSAPKKAISTGLQHLDAILQGKDCASIDPSAPGGLTRGAVTEVYGPPGVGKTTFAMQVSASALHSGNSIIWVDTSFTLVGSRFKKILSGTRNYVDNNSPKSSQACSSESLLDDFHHFTAPTLPHLLALLTHLSTSFPPGNTNLIVVDAISTLFATAFPKAAEKGDAVRKKNDVASWAATRRWAVMGDVISKLSRLAAIQNIAILLVNQTTTRIRADTGAVLHPAIAGTAWDGGIATRIVLFRDWLYQSGEGPSQGKYIPGVRFVGVTKAVGISYDGLGRIISVTIDEHGLQETRISQEEISMKTTPILLDHSLKRKRAEIADSESDNGDVGSDEEFGWAGDNDSLTAEGLLE